MLRFRFWKCSATICGLVLMLTSVNVTHAELTKNQIKILETEFLPAWKVGNTYVVLESMNKAVRKMNAEQLAELDQLLADQKIPSSGELLLDARLQLLRQNLGGKMPKASLRELTMTLQHASEEVQLLVNDSIELLDQMKAVTKDDTFETFDGLLWDKHVLNQRLQSSMFVSEYIVDALKNKKRFKTDSLNEQQKELFDTDFSVMIDELNTVQSRLAEHEIVIRIRRLKHAVSVLGMQRGDRKEQYLASWAISQDGELIRESIKAAGNVKFEHDELQSEDLMAKVEELASLGKQQAGEDLLAKSRLLFEGLHWWYRGRYGMGTDAFGLLKSPAAVDSDQAAFALYMPEETVTPTDPTDNSVSQIPEIDRRHNYIWAWEYRGLGLTNSRTSGVIASGREVTQEVVLSRFY